MSHPHTFGGLCVYCGAASTKEDHLHSCRAFQIIQKQEEEEQTDDADDNKEDNNASPHTMKRKSNTWEVTATKVVEKCRRVSISPPLQQKKTTSPRSRSIWDCLACGEANCVFEDGTNTLQDNKEAEEHDPNQPKLVAAECKEWTKNEALNFEVCKGAIMSVTMGILLSKGFFSHNKFIGSKALDLKLKTWIKFRVPAKLVDSNWVVFRETAKMSLGYKRQVCVAFMRAAFIGESSPVF